MCVKGIGSNTFLLLISFHYFASMEVEEPDSDCSVQEISRVNNCSKTDVRRVPPNDLRFVLEFSKRYFSHNTMNVEGN